MPLIALLLAITAPAYADDADWSGMVYYDGRDKDKKPKPVVPEPANYGFVALGASLAWCLVRRPTRD